MLGRNSSDCSNLLLVDPIIEINDLCKTLGRSAPVRNLSLQVGKGEIVGIISKSGTGPHLMLDLVSGAMAPSSGRIVFSGEDVTDMRVECRTRRGIERVLPISGIVPHFTLLENVLLFGVTRKRPLFPREGGGTDQEEAERLLDFAGLADKAEQPASALQRHDKWRLTIAIAMASRPSLLLLTDCGFHNGKSQAEFGELIRHIANMGTSILFAFRAWHPVMQTCDRIEFLREGEVVAANAVSGTIAEPKPLSLRQRLIRGLLPGRMQRRSEREYSRSSDC